MTSISHPVIPPQASSNSSQSVTQAHIPSGPTSGKTAPQSGGTAPRSYASVSKKPIPTIPAHSNTSSPATVGGAASQHGKTDSVNGKGPIPPAVPVLGPPTIVNGNAAISPTMGLGDHNRKSSVTISAAGASGYMPNGGPVAGKPAGGNPIQFGSMNAAGSPAMSNSAPLHNQSNSLAVQTPNNPRVTSPQSSPSPIPQPTASGGRPPSSLHSGQLNFGSLGGEEVNSGGNPGPETQSLTMPKRQMRSGIPQGPTPVPQPGHYRRESNQSAHGEMNNTNLGPGSGRAPYQQPPQSGRGGRGYNSYHQQIPYSPGPSYRGPPSQPRTQNIAPPFPQQNRYSQYQNSHPGARSPAPANAQPVHPQPGQLPMQSQHMYQQPYGGFPPNMAIPQVKPQSSSPPQNHSIPEQAMAPFSLQNLFNFYAPPDLSPHSGNFEHYLTTRTQNQQFMPPPFDPSHPAASFYHQYPMYGQPQPMQYMAPPSPRPQHPMPHNAQNSYGPSQYNNPGLPPAMSRNPSGMSAPDRPNSSMDKSRTPIPTPSTGHAPSTQRHASSPAPKATEFIKPPRRGALVQIKHPDSGALIDLGKELASPPPTRHSPAIVSSTPTPPPRTPSHTESSHQRSDSKALKTDEEKKNDMREAIIAKKHEADKAEADKAEEEMRQKGEADLRAAEEEREVQARALKLKEEAEAKEAEAARAQLEAEEAVKKQKLEAEEAEKAAAKAKEEDEKARLERETEEEFARIEAELEKKERESEERYQKKKQTEKEEKARREAEAAARVDDDMKKAEQEMEAREDERLAKLEQSGGEESRKERVSLFAALKKDRPPTPPTETSAAAEPQPESGTATPASEASMAPPNSRTSSTVKQRPQALKIETSKPIEPAQPSAQLLSLRSARRLMSINDVLYPAPIASPNPALNTSAPNGKFRYDKDFLLQFQRAFREKPSENWNERINETLGDTTELSSAKASSLRSSAPPMSARQPSNRTASQQSAMGRFNADSGRTLPPGTNSQTRYQASTIGLPPQRPSMQNPLASFVTPRPGGFPVGMSKPMERTASSSSLAPHPSSPRANSSQSQRGGGAGRNKSNRPARENDKLAKDMPLTAGKDLKPIEISASGWKPRSVGANATGIAGPAPGGDGHMAPDIVQRKVKAALNKMTPNNFDKISEQILAIAGQSKDETDGRTLRQVIQLTFEKATDEAHWAQMYAEFCKRMLESMSSEIKDVSILDKKDNVVVGGALFRKYLLTRCQEEFEQGWKINLPAKPDGESEEVTMLSDEYYIAAAAKRRGLGLVRFIGELYKLGMLTERIMHECVKKLVDYEGTPDEAEVESLTSLLKTIGQNLDGTQRGAELMDIYFKRIQLMIETPDLPSRLQFMLMDIVDLRKKGWHGKAGAIKGPTTLDEVRAQAAAAEREKDLQRIQDSSSRRTGGGGGGGGSGRMPMGRGDARTFSSGGQYGIMPPPDFNKNIVGIDDLRRLSRPGGNRQASSQGTAVFGPTSMFGARGSNTRKPLGPSGIGKGGEDSGASSRTGTPPAQKERKEREEKEAAKRTNAFR